MKVFEVLEDKNSQANFFLTFLLTNHLGRGMLYLLMNTLLKRSGSW